jgi:hypothetical protein
MVIAYHAIFTTYGAWLPNDPRGSYSKDVYYDFFRNYAFGKANFIFIVSINIFSKKADFYISG